MEFTCKHAYEDGVVKNWTGTITPLYIRKDMIEAEVKGRGSCFNIILGTYRNGNFICIPDIDVGCAMSRWDDTFWNNERLSGLMNETDAATVVEGVKEMMGRMKRL